jgi:hypothetical protein
VKLKLSSPEENNYALATRSQGFWLVVGYRDARHFEQNVHDAERLGALSKCAEREHPARIFP